MTCLIPLSALCVTVQGLWFLACLKNSLSPERQEHGEAILQAARRELSRSGNTSAARMVAESSELFNDLVLVAREQPAQRRVRMNIGTTCQLDRFLVPTQSALTISYPVRSGDRPGRDSDIPSDDATAALTDSFQVDDHVYFPSDQVSRSYHAMPVYRTYSNNRCAFSNSMKMLM